MLSTTVAIPSSRKRKKIYENGDIKPTGNTQTGSETAYIKPEEEEIEQGLSCVICIGSTGAGKSATISKW